MNPLVTSGLAPHGAGTALSVNLNKVALLRNQRTLTIPSVVRAAQICLEAGAQGITVHPRPDQRHIRTQDVHDLAALLERDWPNAEYNIEGNPFHNLMELVRELRPHQATFVPDAVGQSTSDHGWDLAADGATLKPLIDECHALGVRVSLFMDPAPDAMASTWPTPPQPHTGPSSSTVTWPTSPAPPWRPMIGRLSLMIAPPMPVETVM